MSIMEQDGEINQRMTRSRSRLSLSRSSEQKEKGDASSMRKTDGAKSTSTPVKQRRVSGQCSGRAASSATKPPGEDLFSKLSLELMCHIAAFLPLFDVMKLESLCRRWREAVTLHLKLLHQIDLCEGELYAWMPEKFTDDTFGAFLKRCSSVTQIYGLHPQKVVRRWSRKGHDLSVPGIIAALQNCPCLTGIEISNIFLLEDVLIYLPHICILGCFTNRNGSFPIPLANKFSLVSNYRIVSLNLTGVVVERLPRMGALEEIYVKCVLFTDPLPFRNFAAPFLKTFVMNNCAGPTNTLKYVPMVTALAAASQLQRLELIRVPFLGGLFQHVVEDSWRLQGFRQLASLTIATCKHAMEADLGYLAITAATKLQELCIQPGLTKDRLFSSLLLAEVDFPAFDTLQLGYVNVFPPPGRYSNEELSYMGLADVSETPPSLTDAGLKAAGSVFTNTRKLTVYNCPNLHSPTNWLAPGTWSMLQDLHLQRCHALSLTDLCLLLPSLPALHTLHLIHMFREPPKGCSRVGLSAGTGLGVSSAFVANQAEHNHPLPDDNNNNNESDDEVDHIDNVLIQAADGDAVEAVVEDDGPMEVEEEAEAHAQAVLEDGLYNLGSYNNDAVGSTGLHTDVAPAPHSQPPTAASATVSSTTDLTDAPGTSTADTHVEARLSEGSKQAAIPNDSQPARSQDSTSSTHCQSENGSHSGAPVTRDSDHPHDDTLAAFSKDSCTPENPQPGCSAGSPDCPTGSPRAGRGKSLSGKKKGLVKKRSSAAAEQHDKLSVAEDQHDRSSSAEEQHNRSSSAEEHYDRSLAEKQHDQSSSAEEQHDRSSAVEEQHDRSSAMEEQHSRSSPAEEQHDRSSVAVEQHDQTRAAKDQHDQSHPAADQHDRLNESLDQRDRSRTAEEQHDRSGTAEDQHDQSCQAVSEEIRESTTTTAAPAASLGESDEVCWSRASQTACVCCGRETAREAGARGGAERPDTGSSCMSEQRAASSGRKEKCADDEHDHTSNEGPAANTRASRGAARRVRSQGKGKSKRKVQHKDQSTSTSDPIIDEDHVQELNISSGSLQSIILEAVGITDLVLTNCPNLHNLTVRQCRVLHNVRVTIAPRLTCVTMAQCRKLDHTLLVKEVCSQPADTNRLIILRPVNEYSVGDMERALLQPASINYHTYLLHDYTSNPAKALESRMRVDCWLDILMGITREILKVDNVVASRDKSSERRYPWGRNLVRVHGMNKDDTYWELVSDIPWIRTQTLFTPVFLARLSGKTANDGKQSSKSSDSFKAMFKHYMTDIVKHDIAEVRELKQGLFSHSAVVIVNMCDVGKATPIADKYF